MDELVGHVGSVELRRVDVVDASLDSPAYDGQCDRAVLWRTEDPGPGQLHGAEPHAVDGAVGEKDGIAWHAPILSCFRAPS